MKTGINSQTALLAIGILQPATAKEIRGYLLRIFPDVSVIPSEADYRAFLGELELSGRAVSYRRGSLQLYSLTTVASHELSAKARRVRDKRRLYLLRSARRGRFSASRGGSKKELAGASPALDTRSLVKGSEAKSIFGLAKMQDQKFSWPRISEQFAETGPSLASPRDTFPALLSFCELDAAAMATGIPLRGFHLDFVGLGAVVGISPKLISQMVHNQSRHYRSFSLPKRGGGERRIESPRVFLKVVQWVLLDFFFKDLRVSDAVQAFEIGKSIVSNAVGHVGRNFVAAFDIKDFFGSVTTEAVKRLLIRNGYKADEAALIALLCTKDGKLPQGAPTSPALSNALLFDFDEWSIGEARQHGFTYTRYADDITVSSESRGALQGFIAKAERYLRNRYSLQLNEAKTRISSRHGRQVVTGVVVNQVATPPRKRLRQIRAAFHQASLAPAEFISRVGELAGLMGYLGQFPKFYQSNQLRDYMIVLSQVRLAAKEQVKMKQKKAVRSPRARQQRSASKATKMR
jgi:retron-type reverse transcriptase